mgnify:CR=1 FL=1
MNARQIEVFRAVMLSGSLTAAAQMLNVSQPAASKVLRHLESQLGYNLFERIGGRLHPTAEAHLLFGDADRIFREIEMVKDLAYRIRENKTGLLRVGASAPPTFSIIPAALKRFRSRMPHVRVVLRTLPAIQLNEQILMGELDLGLTLSSGHVSSLTSEVLMTAPIVAVMRRDAPLAKKQAVTVRDLAEEELISYSSHAEAGALLDRTFEAEGYVRRIGIEIPLSVSAMPLVEAGLGIALVDGMLPWSSFGHVIARPFHPKILLSVNILTNSARPVQRIAHEFIKDIRAVSAPAT